MPVSLDLELSVWILVPLILPSALETIQQHVQSLGPAAPGLTAQHGDVTQSKWPEAGRSGYGKKEPVQQKQGEVSRER
jgi:hypothetical protein